MGRLIFVFNNSDTSDDGTKLKRPRRGGRRMGPYDVCTRGAAYGRVDYYRSPYTGGFRPSFGARNKA